MSLLSDKPELLGYVEEFFRAKRLREASGSPAIAAALADWPAAVADAWEVMESEEVKYQNALQRAMHPPER